MLKNKHTIVVVDDHPIVLEGLTKMLDKEKGLDVTGSFSNGKDLLGFLENHHVDIVLLDISLPDINGIDLCREIKNKTPQTIVLAFSNHNERSTIMNMLHSGASGYLLKSTSPREIVTAIYEVLNAGLIFSQEIQQIIAATEPAVTSGQEIRLTNREKEILKMIASGDTTQQIAKKLFLSKFTVENHRKNILQKLRVKNVAELIAAASRQGWIP